MDRPAIAQSKPVVKGAKELQTLHCPICKKRFKQRRWWQKQCSVRCTDKAYKLRQFEHAVAAGVEELRQQITEEVLQKAIRGELKESDE